MRTCPKCLSKINDPQASFCYSCGARLEVTGVKELNEDKINTISDSLSNKSGESNTSVKSVLDSPKTNKISADTLSKKWNYFIVGVNALSVLFLIVALGVFFRASNPIKNDLSLLPVVMVESVSIDKDTKINLTDYVNKSEYYKIVPKTVSSYSEISDLQNVVKNIISDSDKKYLESTLDMSFEDFLVFFKKDFAYITYNNKQALILKVGGFDFFDRAYAKYQESKKENAGIYLKRVGEYFVISNSTELINLMESVSQGTEGSLSSDVRFKSKILEVQNNPVFYTYISSVDNYKDFVDKTLPKLNLQDLQKYFIKFKATVVSISKQGNEYTLYPVE